MGGDSMSDSRSGRGEEDRKHWDNTPEEMETYFLQPGYIYASREPVFLNTVLGSCVAVAIWDSMLSFGGMCHFIYPNQKKNTRSARYGDVALPHLIRLMTDLGSAKANLKAHITGGGIKPELNSSVGEGNAKVAETILLKHRIEIVTLDVGGMTGKKVSFNTQSGELLVYTTTKVREADWYR